MILSEEEKAFNREAFRNMSLANKADYIFTYYKLPLVLALIAAVALGTVVYRTVTHKDPLLYVAFANVVPPTEVENSLTTAFVEAEGANPRKSEVLCYRELYLSKEANTPDHQYAYASRLKLMASAEGQMLDVALMNQEAYDLLSASGYLMSLEDAFAGNEHLCTNTVIVEDNQVEVDLNEADAYKATTLTQANALEVTNSPMLEGFSGTERIYMGIVANTPRADIARTYLAYVCG